MGAEFREYMGSIYHYDGDEILYEMTQPAVLFSKDVWVLHCIGNRSDVMRKYEEKLIKMKSLPDIAEDLVVADLPLDAEMLTKVLTHTGYLEKLFSPTALDDLASYKMVTDPEFFNSFKELGRRLIMLSSFFQNEGMIIPSEQLYEYITKSKYLLDEADSMIREGRKYFVRQRNTSFKEEKYKYISIEANSSVEQKKGTQEFIAWFVELFKSKKYKYTLGVGGYDTTFSLNDAYFIIKLKQDQEIIKEIEGIDSITVYRSVTGNYLFECWREGEVFEVYADKVYKESDFG